MAKSKSTNAGGAAKKRALGLVHTIDTPQPGPTPTRVRKLHYLITFDKRIYCNSVVCVVGHAEDGGLFPTKMGARVQGGAPTAAEINGAPSRHVEITLPGLNPDYEFSHLHGREVPCDCTDTGKSQYLLVWPFIGGTWRPAATVAFMAKCCQCTQCQECACDGAVKKTFGNIAKKVKSASKKKKK